jgi:transcriptional regulator with XRE-family HTH domain
MDLGGDDITSVQYQNANDNDSVRARDTFMKAVEAGGKFGRTSRMTGEIIASGAPCLPLAGLRQPLLRSVNYRCESHGALHVACATPASKCLQKLAPVRQHQGMASLKVGHLGEFLREQRRGARLSLRQLADAAGVSNPYLSQIERGLRKPSAEILQQLAKALRISAETLYVQAGILDERDRDEVEVRSVILADPSINDRQKQVLLQIYESFRKENGHGSARTAAADAVTSAAGTEAPADAATPSN